MFVQEDVKHLKGVCGGSSPNTSDEYNAITAGGHEFILLEGLNTVPTPMKVEFINTTSTDIDGYTIVTNM